MAQAPTQLSAEDFLSEWTDSLGNAVSVCSEDAFASRIVATLSRPPRPDIILKLRPEQSVPGGWRCGNSVLDSYNSSTHQVCWHTMDGRVSVWVRRPVYTY